MKLKVVVEKDECGYYVVECPALPGCISQGRTLKEALDNIKEAIELWIETYNEKILKECKGEVTEVLV